MRQAPFFLLLILICVGCSSSKKTIAPTTHRTTTSTYHRYIKEYNPLAIEQQNKYKIPASITLAQGLLESGAGQSSLAKKSNNHFGIKCHSDWKGGRVYHNDDRKGECFRKYKNVGDSYEDHSRFHTRIIPVSFSAPATHDFSISRSRIIKVGQKGCKNAAMRPTVLMRTN